MTLGIFADVQQFWTTYGGAITLTVGAVAVLAGAVLGWRWFRHGEAHKRTGTFAVVLATAFSAEGMWEVARQALHLEVYLALVLFAMFEVVMVNQGLLAKHKLSKNQPVGAQRHMRFVWLIAFVTGGIASTNSDNLTEFCLRLAAPSVAAGIWWTTLTADGIAKVRSAVTLRWSPRRLALWLGAIEPGENDVKDVDRSRRLDKLVDLVHLRQTGKLSKRQARKLSRLERHADDEMLDEVIRRMDRSVWFRTTLDTPEPPPLPAAPVAVPAPPVVYPPAPQPVAPRHPRLVLPIIPAAPVSLAASTPVPPVPWPIVPPPLSGAATPPSAPPVNGSGTPAPRRAGTPTPRSNGTRLSPPTRAATSDGTPDVTPGDEELLAVLRDPARVPRNPDGTVPTKRAIRVLGVGRPRALRLLDTLGLRQNPDPDDGADTPPVDGSGTGADDEERLPKTDRINGNHPELAAAAA
jgi:hypothetical protein